MRNDTIVSVTKQDGDNWLINARMKYGDSEIVAPIPAQVKWAGDTPVICITNLTIPGGGTYNARVLIYEHTYAGTWSGKDRGGSAQRNYHQRAKVRAEGPSLYSAPPDLQIPSASATIECGVGAWPMIVTGVPTCTISNNFAAIASGRRMHP